MSHVILVVFLGTIISVVIGNCWARYYLGKVVVGGSIANINAFNRPPSEFMLVLMLASVIGVLSQLWIAAEFEQDMEKVSRERPVSEYVLRTLGYDGEREIKFSDTGGWLSPFSASDARKQLAQSLKGDQRPLAENQLYLEFLTELFGEIPGLYLERDSDSFKILRKFLQREESGSNLDQAHGEFHELLRSIGLSAPGTASGTLVPLPSLSIWSITHERTIDPGGYLRLEIQGKGRPSEIWRELFNYRGGETLSFDEKAERLALLTAYLRHYNAMFSSTLTMAALCVGPIQLALTVLFFLTFTIFSMRLTICQNPAIQAYIESEVVGNSEKINSWETYIENVPYAPINYSTWAIPSIGFIGTVFGIKLSLGSAEMVVSAADRGEQILAVGKVTELLSLAFDTTLVALVFNVILMSLFFAVRSLESRLVHK